MKEEYIKFDKLKSIFDKATLLSLMDDCLLDDDLFVADLDNTITNKQLKTLSHDERLSHLSKHIIGNTARTEILLFFVLQHLTCAYEKELSRIADPYWSNILQKYLETHAKQ